MGVEAVVALIAGLVALIPLIIKAINNRKANRNDLGKVESQELLDGMDAVDRATDPERVQPVQPKD